MKTNVTGCHLTSGVVVLLILGERRSTLGFDSTDFGDRPNERREFCKGECESGSDLEDDLLPLLLTLEVAGEAFLVGVSDRPDLLVIPFSDFS